MTWAKNDLLDNYDENMVLYLMNTTVTLGRLDDVIINDGEQTVSNTHTLNRRTRARAHIMSHPTTIIDKIVVQNMNCTYFCQDSILAKYEQIYIWFI